MKTALRTYHPVPALQRTNGNLQDAPRIKNILKTCFLHDEAQGKVSTPSDVLARSRSGIVPPTSIVNLIFVFANHAMAIARKHFEPGTSVDFLDLFTPVPISSESRARAFLWLCYHYHEAPSENPFSDEHADGNPDRAPRLIALTPQQAAAENVDTQEENQRGVDMTDIRRRFLETKARGEDFATNEAEYSRYQSSGSKGRSKGKGKAMAESSRTRETSPAESQYSARYSLGVREEDMLEGPGRPPLRRLSSPGPDLIPSRRAPTPPYRQRPYRAHSPEGSAFPRAAADPYPRRPPSPGVDLLQHSNGKPTRTHSRKPREHSSRHTPLFVHETCHRPSGLPPYSRPTYPTAKYVPPAPEVPRRTMLEQAWHVSMTTDPLIDSDDEAYVDENTRLDYVLRLRIISRLRGKEPTPPRELGPYSVDPTNPLAAYGAR
ncbi:hypothetical protein BV20DRAFT_961469 [Pilatotrama ljubarskyi]|nr:hypothetical protein BV20DRAFT_961469 [Pilatotrama ljubarskyi]